MELDTVAVEVGEAVDAVVVAATEATVEVEVEGAMVLSEEETKRLASLAEA